MRRFLLLLCAAGVGCVADGPGGVVRPGSSADGRTEIHMPPRRVKPFFVKKKAEDKDDAELIREQIAANASYIKYLQAKYKKVHPDLAGKVDVELSVDEYGTVESCTVVYQSLGVPAMVRDIVGFLEGMRFEGLKIGDVIVGYQFFF